LWTAIAAGVLIKGPLILMFLGLTGATLVFFDRGAPWLRDLKMGYGLAWVAAVVLPWFVAIVMRSGDSFFVESVGNDMLSKVASGQESHGVPPGLYFVLFWATFFPGSMLAALAAPAVWRTRFEPAVKFLLAWIVPSWLVFELVPTKLPHYVLPLYPAIAILIGTMIDRGALSRHRWLVPGTLWWPLITAGIAVVAMAAHFALAQRIGFAPLPFLIAALIGSLFAWWLYRYDGAERSLLRAGLASIMISFAMFGMTFPLIRALFPSYYLVDNLRYAGCPNPEIATAGLHEPSLVFLAGTDLVHTDGTGAAQFLSRGGCRVAFVDVRYQRPFAAQAEAIGLRYSAFGAPIEGYNISGGRPVSISSYRAGAPP
jgi:4-amino-4-deoxy-L-arabinose transferase-like glycosyltransferase